MKPTSSFKLSKRTKTMMSRIVDNAARNQFKRMMIEAELAASFKPKTGKADKE